MYRLARGEGIRLQYSVFLMPWEDLPEGFSDAVEKIIDPQQDDVRVYHLPAGTRVWYTPTGSDHGLIEMLL